MKIEEVLPAMREGRVAVFEGTRYRIVNGVLQLNISYKDERWTHSALFLEPALDGWTLEPAPKVEWPKGSMQWACAQVERLNQKITRRGHGWNVAVGAIDRTHIGWDSFFALDWEVVP